MNDYNVANEVENATGFVSTASPVMANEISVDSVAFGPVMCV